jgi:hypothetical protein
MQWMTWEWVKVDRVACPWWIRKFIDAQAEREGAIPYDVTGVERGHPGKECSFEAILQKYYLNGDAALVLLGRIVNGADTDNTRWQQPEGPGLGTQEQLRIPASWYAPMMSMNHLPRAGRRSSWTST